MVAPSFGRTVEGFEAAGFAGAAAADAGGAALNAADAEAAA